jgi:hypothetical protein
MKDAGGISPEQAAALLALGVQHTQFAIVLRGEAIVYRLPTDGGSGIALLQLVESRLRSGIVEVTAPGEGLMTFFRFRSQSLRAAAAFGVSELELFGAEVINPKIVSILTRHGYKELEDRCPDDLGGGAMMILSRIFPVQ